MFKPAFEGAYFATAVAEPEPQVHRGLCCIDSNAVSTLDFIVDGIFMLKDVVVYEVVDRHVVFLTS